MPKTNTKGGKKKKRGKNGVVEPNNKRIVLKTPGQVYGQITKTIGGGKFNVLCYDNKMNPIERICLVRGSMRKKIWLKPEDFVLVALREYGNLHDIINKYNLDEIQYLKETQCIPSSIFDNNPTEVDFMEYNKNNEGYIDIHKLSDESENSDVPDEN